jgi:Rieske Fe-S protein
MDRRQFLTHSCSLCLCLGGGTLLSGCSGMPVIAAARNANQVVIPRSALQRQPPHIVRVAGLRFDIALVQEPSGAYRALLLKCTHAAEPLSPLGSGFACSAHGSRFGMMGSVVRGPAQSRLAELPTRSTAHDVIVELGGVDPA